MWSIVVPRRWSLTDRPLQCELSSILASKSGPIIVSAFPGASDRMIYRWTIRSVSIAMCMLCVGVWFTSWFEMARMDYVGGSHARRIAVECGVVSLSDHFNPAFTSGTWRVTHEQADLDYDDSDAGFMSYSYPEPSWGVMVPMWFFTGVSVVLLWMSWRKSTTRTAGFPIAPNL